MWARQVAPSEGTPRQNTDVLFLGQREHLAFLLTVDEVVVVLHRLEPL
jgi:hypothetical protein